MAFCTNCGHQLVDGAKFCFECGVKVDISTVSHGEARKTVYDGEIHKCPNCGDILDAYESVCKTCGYERRGAKATNSVQELSKKLQEIESLRPPKKASSIFKQALSQGQLSTTDEQKIDLIKNFAIPNSKGGLVKSGQVIGIVINGQDGFNRYEWYPVDALVEVEFYEPETEEEVAAAHPGQKRIPDSSKRYLGRTFEAVITELQEAGFANISLECQKKSKKNWLSKEGAISKISVNGQTQFEKGEWFAEEALIRIAYYSYSSDEVDSPIE